MGKRIKLSGIMREIPINQEPETLKDNITVKGHHGTWYVIDKADSQEHGKIYLLEHEQLGDETACLIVDGNKKILVDDVYNGFDDYFDFHK